VANPVVLNPFGGKVRVTIEFDHQGGIPRVEVEDIEPERVLPTELVPGELPVP
jgi:hypothetical protein